MKRVFLACALVCLPLVVAHAAEVPIPPPPARWATDTARFMSPQALRVVDGVLESFERTTGNQVLVWIGETTGDAVLEDWTVRAFERWKVGRKGLDNGLILFVFAKDRSARIEVGYGLEDKVPDAIASRILNEVILPRIGADRDGAVQAGVDALLTAISGGTGGVIAGGTPTEPGEGASPARSRGRPISVPQMVLVGLLVIGFLILLVTNPSLALYLLFSILSGGRGGGGGGGGGFSGGGGSSGGGGASGRW
jgi:uncharacterized protein